MTYFPWDVKIECQVGCDHVKYLEEQSKQNNGLVTLQRLILHRPVHLKCTANCAAYLKRGWHSGGNEIEAWRERNVWRKLGEFPWHDHSVWSDGQEDAPVKK